jgi:hypothetical protein
MQNVPIQKQQHSTKNYAISHLPYPKYTYTNPAVFNPKTTPKSHLPCPKCTYTRPAVFNPKVRHTPTCPNKNVPIKTSSIQFKNYAKIPPAPSKMYLYRTRIIQ